MWASLSIGLVLLAADPEVQKGTQLGIYLRPADKGVEIRGVIPGGLAAQMRLSKGAVITRINDTDVTDPETLREAMGKTKDRIELEYTRDGRRQEPIKGQVVRTAVKSGKRDATPIVVFLKDR